jgi:hypothetical protein
MLGLKQNLPRRGWIPPGEADRAPYLTIDFLNMVSDIIRPLVFKPIFSTHTADTQEETWMRAGCEKIARSVRPPGRATPRRIRAQNIIRPAGPQSKKAIPRSSLARKSRSVSINMFPAMGTASHDVIQGIHSLGNVGAFKGSGVRQRVFYVHVLSKWERDEWPSETLTPKHG